MNNFDLDLREGYADEVQVRVEDCNLAQEPDKDETDCKWHAAQNCEHQKIDSVDVNLVIVIYFAHNASRKHDHREEEQIWVHEFEIELENN